SDEPKRMRCSITMSSPGDLTVSEAARRLAVSKVTIRRALEAGRFPSAYREPHRGDGRWLIPWRDIERSGLLRTAPLRPPANTGDSALERVVEIQAQTIARQTALIDTLTRRLDELGYPMPDARSSDHGA
ncbi:MAG: helix-turn-helix domain-containing protein, partial [Caldilineaceae bacterium]|nr:helix-turn-helix domain-containing protein [Caldilineaceae bacterium]